MAYQPPGRVDGRSRWLQVFEPNAKHRPSPVTLMSSKLGLRYAPNLNPAIAANLELAGRQSGMPLGELELLGQDEAFALDFIASVVANRARLFLVGVDWEHLEDLYQRNHAMIAPIVN